jgi:hypothetical protein
MVGPSGANCNIRAVHVARRTRPLLELQQDATQEKKYGYFTGFAGNAGLSRV